MRLRASRPWGRFPERSPVFCVAFLAALALSGCARGDSPGPASGGATVAGGCPHAGETPQPGGAAGARAAVLCLVNGERRRHGLAALVEDPSLRAAAESHSSDMALRNYFEHDTPEGVKPWMRITGAGYQALLVGENLAWGEDAKSAPAAVMRLWMTSDGHRANVLEPRYTQIGIGLAFESPEPRPSDLPAVIYTTTFGSAAVTTR